MLNELVLRCVVPQYFFCDYDVYVVIDYTVRIFLSTACNLICAINTYIIL